MSDIVIILAIIFSFIIGLVAGALGLFLGLRVVINRQMRTAEQRAAKIALDAKEEARNLLQEARAEVDKTKQTTEAEFRERRSELARQENRLNQKEETLDRKLQGVTQREHSLASKEKEIETVRASLNDLKDKQLKKLEVIAAMTSEEAKKALMEALEAETKIESSRRLKEWETKLKEEADVRSREILSQAIQRLASEVVQETTVSVVPIPSDEMKGRLIGREGRNIRALEQATGVDLIIDDTPEAVTLSSFDPVRREIARQALNKLVLDGRIHPARIEEVVAKTKEEVEATIHKAGEEAALETEVHGLRPELIRLIGRLKYRTSYGQNVLAHSIETAHIAGMMAAELGANISIAKRAGLLHDIGKAVDHEVEGSHAAIGADLVKQWDKSPEVVSGIVEHHGETGNMSFWGFIISAADAISGGRPGARRESLEGYIKRLRALEDIANSFKGVDKSYAIQAGREIRILVKPEEVDDLGAVRLARDIVKKIEEGLEYPGQIRVTVLRETRAVDFAK